MNENLFSRFREKMSDPDKVFAHLPGRRTVTYADLIETSGRMAHALTASGVKPGDRVAAQIDKCVDGLMLYLACLRSGAVYLPLNTGYTPTELDYFLSDASPALFICAPRNEAELRPLAQRVGVGCVHTLGVDGSGSWLELAAGHSGNFEDCPRSADDLAGILYTSGTTGRSKGAMLTHGNLASNCESLREAWHYTAADVLLHALPIFHTHGLFVATNVTLISNATLVLLPGFDLEQILQELPRCTTMMGVPTFYLRLVASGRLNPEFTAHMRLFISGSAPLSPDTHREFEALTGHAILERYGMTETNMIASNPYDGDRRPGTVGFALPDVELRIADRETGAILAQGEVGVIEVRGPNVFSGYWQMPEKTKQEFRNDGFFITGDLGLIDDRGYLNIVGRDKDLIISGGYNVYPAEIETAIDEIPAVLESAVIGLPHPDFGEGVTAVVAGKPDTTVSEADILAALRDKLARYKQPKRVIFVDELPRNKTGKIQKAAMREQYANLYQ